MLKTLRIRNYAIINEAEIQFSGALNVITGETGAGKSILLGALSLLTGERADTKVLFDKSKKCIVEGVFDIGNYNLQDFFSAENIDYEKETIIRRELSDAGKSRAFVNDTPVNLSVLQDLADQLVTIHSQHETLALSDSKFQLKVIDALADTQKILAEYRKDFYQWKEVSEQLEETIAFSTKAMNDKDYIQFQYEELEAAGLDNIRQEELEKELEQLTHAEEIKRNVIQSVEILENGQQSISDQLRIVISQLQAVSKYNDELKNYIDRLEISSIELKDITRDLHAKTDHMTADPQRAEELSQKLNSIFRLQKKHKIKTVDELIVLKNNFEETLNAFNNSEETIERLKKELAKLFVSLGIKAKKLSDKRKDIFSLFEKQIKNVLSDVGLQDADFVVQHHFDIDKYITDSGADVIQFLFSANKGSAPQDIRKVASGGELSRLMLAIKSRIAASTALPTLIFDEIDTGVSGEIAHKVGNILLQLSKNHQVITITHLPQIASKGDHHLYVYKESTKTSAQTNIKLLQSHERLHEIAKMLSGEKPTASAVKTAAELLEV
ncbi:MAG: DNA repair protein RecN [Chitinophagales bacterium]|nr:DNA repair protein RecN [Chitinophagales bacterium]